MLFDTSGVFIDAFRKHITHYILIYLPKDLSLYYRYYSSESGKDFNAENSELTGTVYHHIFQLDATIQGVQKPDGGVNFPGKSCKDLKLCHPGMESGE